MYGGIVKFETCNYVANMAQVGTQVYMYLTRDTISIEYSTSLLRKITEWNTNYSLQYDFVEGFEFLTCGLSKIEYHPGLKALYYFQTQNPDRIILLIDKGYPATADPCVAGQELFATTANNIRKHADLGTLIKA
jgi:hypothetical protein